MSFLRFLMLLSLITWIGGLIFFAFVLAPTAFTIPDVLPNTHLAGNVVGRALSKLHWMAIVSAFIFLVTSILLNQLSRGSAHIFAARNVLVFLMLVLTLVSQFGIMPRMDVLRAELGDVNSVPLTNPLRMKFDSLHAASTRVEGLVLLLGLFAVYLTTSALRDRWALV